MKVLNLYAGIGGNRKLWTDVEVTAVEYKEEIANIYKILYPSDNIVIGDAHQYLLEHYSEFDFIWASPPCPTHSRFNLPIKKKRYPDMSLYQEIIFLTWFFKGKFCVENVISYYDPLIVPQKIDGHYFWTNYRLSINNKDRDLQSKNTESLACEMGFDLNRLKELFNNDNEKVSLALRNCVYPQTGLRILEIANGVIKSQDIKQKTIFDL